MPDLKTTYMGIPLRSPIVVGASSVSGMLDKIKMAEQVGAGALVIRSLFEEQIQFDALRMEESLAVGSDSFAEALTYFPNMKHGDAKEHLMWVEKARKAVAFPLLASLNAVSPGVWIEYARQLEAPASMVWSSTCIRLRPTRAGRGRPSRWRCSMSSKPSNSR